ncbi:MAG: class I SAM-dependent methyltransferase [Bdellovibrionaceae bacterium]|nr:class I SAM-dependent methyltransferase [Bdellovibrio sp.]
MDLLTKFSFTYESQQLALQWLQFLQHNNFNFENIKEINLTGKIPIIYDMAGNKFSIDFNENRINYHKKKSTIKSEILSRALGAGRAGLRVLDISAGLAIDTVFLAQLGYQVTALERNPLIFLALQRAYEQCTEGFKINIKFFHASAIYFLNTNSEIFDVIYFDPMFPEKTKSALPRQEMVFFKSLVGNDSDAVAVLKQCVRRKGLNRVVVKRPLKAPVLGLKPHSHVDGKLIRFDIYGVQHD